ncbi:hypothetical protein Tco_1284706 [Tanacetum coccineum]
MDSDKYLEGQSMQRPPLFESDSFIYWKNRFETYVKSKDLDLWHVITNGDFQPIVQNPETKLDEVIPFEKQSDDLKRRLAKNNKAKMVIYNALPRKEYERIFMCNTAKEIWKTLLITHQGNSQVKDNKIDLLVQQYEQFVIFEDKSIDSAFARFNTIITSLKALDEDSAYTVHSTALQVYCFIDNTSRVLRIDQDLRSTSGIRACALRNFDLEVMEFETAQSNTTDKLPILKLGEYEMWEMRIKQYFQVQDYALWEVIENGNSWPPKNNDQRAFIGGAWSDNGEDEVEKTKDETCLVAQAPDEICLGINLER